MGFNGMNFRFKVHTFHFNRFFESVRLKPGEKIGNSLLTSLEWSCLSRPQ
jgi:hypothetical protein